MSRIKVTNVALRASFNPVNIYSNFASIAPTKGAELVGFKWKGVNAVATNLYKALSDQCPTLMYGMTDAERIAVITSNYTSVTRVNVAIQNIINNFSSAGGGIMLAPPGLYMIGARVTIPANVVILGSGQATIFKSTADNISTNGLLFGFANTSKVGLLDCTLDGNSSALLADTPLLFQIFNTSDILLRKLKIQNSKGIGILLSTNIKRLELIDPEFENVGFTTGIGGTKAKQALTFSSGGHEDITIKGGRFKKIGLDCISLGGALRATINDNKTLSECYTLIYNVIGTELQHAHITDNKATSDLCVSGGDKPQPNGIDLPGIVDSIVSGNIATDCANTGLGIFQGSRNVLVKGNISLRNSKGPIVSYPAGIAVKGQDANRLANIFLHDNICFDDQVTKTQEYGLVYDPNDVDNLVIGSNNYFYGNKLGDIGLLSYPDTGNGTLIRVEPKLNSTPEHPGYVVSNWYAPPNVAHAASPVAQATDKIYLCPVAIQEPITISTLGGRIGTGVASTLAKFAIYANNKNSRPGVLLRKTSLSVSGDSAASVEAVLDSNLSLMPGLYWLAAHTSGTISFKTISVSTVGVCAIGSPTLADVANGVNVVAISTPRAFASDFPADLSNFVFTNVTDASCPLICFKVA